MSFYKPGPAWQQECDTRKNIVSDPLAVIYNEGQWKLNNVSPLYNLQYDAVKLKQYASKIRQSVVNVVANISVKYTVKCEVQYNLKYSKEDSDGLMISISSTQENNTKTKQVYSAILLSWGVSNRLDDATHLPYMLERGEQKLGAAVRASLQTIFDCNIKQYSFTQQQLLYFGFNFLENDSSRNNEPFTLSYKTSPVDVKDKLDVSFDLEDIKIILNGVKEEVTKKSELINITYQMLQNQIFDVLSLDITVFDLYAVSLPKAEIKCGGIVKMKTPEIVNCVFTILNEISDVYNTQLHNVSD